MENISSAEITLLRNVKSFMGEMPDDDDISDYDLITHTLIDSVLEDTPHLATLSPDQKRIVRRRFDLLQRIRATGEATNEDFDELKRILSDLELLYV